MVILVTMFIDNTFQSYFFSLFKFQKSERVCETRTLFEVIQDHQETIFMLIQAGVMLIIANFAIQFFRQMINALLMMFSVNKTQLANEPTQANQHLHNSSNSDASSSSRQPYTDNDNRYRVVQNEEYFNRLDRADDSYKTIINQLPANASLRTSPLNNLSSADEVVTELEHVLNELRPRNNS